MEILELLKNLNIKYEIVNHKKVYTSLEAEFIKDLIDETSAKNLFLKDKKNNYYLYILEDTKKADLKLLKEKLNVNNLSFATEQELNNILSLEKGSVTPLGIINDKNNLVTVLIDSDLKDKKILVHPNRNDATISVSYNDLIKFIEYLNHKYILIEQNKTHEMRLHKEPFDLIKSGIKNVEYRLNDEKRKEIKIGDKIIFYKRPNFKEKIEAKVTDLKYYNDLLEMYTDTFDLYLKDNYETPQDAVIDTPYYTEEEVKKYGCVTIFIEKL